jgi:redox-sensitive bicupin YhaK (pirin superfamily)
VTELVPIPDSVAWAQHHPAGRRFHTAAAGIDSWHSFSFGSHHHSANTHHGLLLANNEDRIEAGRGYDSHAHRDMEILTWVLSGVLVHRDSEGGVGVVGPGQIQRLSAGTGVRHSEYASASGDLHLIQMWVPPDEFGRPPSYDQAEVDPNRLANALVPVASGLAHDAGEAVLRIRNRQAALLIGRLDPGRAVDLPDAPYIQLFVARGTVQLAGIGSVSSGDAVRLAAAGPRQVTGSDTGETAEILVWEMFSAAFE